jgi:ribosomal protein L16 Arg81 hydroxylase
MQLQHQAMPTLGRFTNQIESYFGFRTQSTVFLTPANSHGFTRHFDSHDFFTMPIKGNKTWRIYKERVECPLPSKEVLDSDVSTTGDVELELELKPGDTLYVPRGVFHDARGEGEASMQISLGVFPYYWVDILHKAIDDLADQHATLRKAAVSTAALNAPELEAGFDEILEILKRDVRIADTVSALQERSRSRQLKDSTRRMRDLDALHELTPETRFICRDVDVRTSTDGETVSVAFYNKALNLPSFVQPQLASILNRQAFCAASLPDSVDLPGRLFLIRKLVVEGLITQVAHAN